jgi:hypothetical protein
MHKLLTSLSRAIPKTRALATPLAKPIAAATTTTRTFTTTTTAKMGSTTPAKTANGSDAFLSLVQSRRSIYPLTKDLPIAASRVQSIISESLLHVPSSFNSQSNRAVVLLGAEHEKLWDLTAEVLRGIVPADAWEATGKKMAMFRAAAGTALFFEDQDVVQGMQARFPLYADRYVYSPTHCSLGPFYEREWVS